MEGSTPGEGRVEVYYNDSWARVCNDGWDNDDSTVVCKQLVGSVHTGSSSSFGQGTGTVLLDQVGCNSGQLNIFDCRHNGFGNHDCSRAGAGVRCSGSHSKCCYNIIGLF